MSAMFSTKLKANSSGNLYPLCTGVAEEKILPWTHFLFMNPARAVLRPS